MNHLSEEELIAHFYGEDANRAATRQHLDGCAECSIAFAEIESDLGVLKAVEAPARDEAYGRRHQRRPRSRSRPGRAGART